ncbi:MAG: VOC family protein [Candidatus Latescibacterota bacterium]
MSVTFKHANIIARDWASLAEFYERVLGCVRVPPERHLSGAWLEKGTGVPGASFSGVHLRLPGHGESGPTLEIFQYARNEEKPRPLANREGFSHIAFEVDDVFRVMELILAHGGSMIGEVTRSEVEGVGLLTFVYLADPEGNIIELQTIHPAASRCLACN